MVRKYPQTILDIFSAAIPSPNIISVTFIIGPMPFLRVLGILHPPKGGKLMDAMTVTTGARHHCCIHKEGKLMDVMTLILRNQDPLL